MFRFFVGFFSILFVSTGAIATPMLFVNNTAGFDAVTQNLLFQEESFELSDQQWAARCGDTAPEACAPSNRYAESQQFGQVLVTADDDSRFRIETAFKNSGDFVSDGLSSISAAPGGYQNWGPISFSFDTAINAISFDLLDLATSIGTSALIFSTDSGYQSLLFSLTGTDDNNGRLDVISFYDPDQAFSAFTLSFDCSLTSNCATDDLIGVDAMRFAAVPEPDTLILLFAGLLLLASLKRRQLKVQTQYSSNC
jgi:hypothetical protein